jgi:hypothetical protein
MGKDYEDMDLIFATPKGTSWNAHNVVNRQFQPTLEAAGLRRVRFHDLRHTTASLLINQGVSPKVIQRQLRHASIDTTFDRYGHLFPETHQEAAQKHQEAAQKLDEAIFGRQGGGGIRFRDRISQEKNNGPEIDQSWRFYGAFWLMRWGIFRTVGGIREG